MATGTFASRGISRIVSSTSNPFRRMQIQIEKNNLRRFAPALRQSFQRFFTFRKPRHLELDVLFLRSHFDQENIGCIVFHQHDLDSFQSLAHGFSPGDRKLKLAASPLLRLHPNAPPEALDYLPADRQADV